MPDHLPPDIDLSLARPLDPSIYDADVEFLSAVTGIKDYEQLKQHVLRVQADAYAVRTFSVFRSVLVQLTNPSEQVFPYPCIRNFAISKCVITACYLNSYFIRLLVRKSILILAMMTF